MIIKQYTKVNFKKFIENNRDILLNQCDFECEVNSALLFKNKTELNVFLTTLRLLTNNLEERNKMRIERL